MDLRFVTRKLHALIDYPVAISLMAMPFLLGLGESSPFAFWLSFVTGAAAFGLTLLTQHETGVVKVLPYKIHLAVDFMVGVVFLAAPLLLGFTGIDLIYYVANAGAVLTVVGLHCPVQVATVHH